MEHAPPPDELHRDQQDRYGSRVVGRRRRWVRPVLLCCVILAGIGVAFVGYRNLGTQPIQGTPMAVVFGDHSVTITFDVTRDRPAQPADCIVRSLSQAGDEVGRKEVYVPAGGGTVQLRTVLRTSAQPATGDVYGCSYHVPPYLSAQPPPSG